MCLYLSDSCLPLLVVTLPLLLAVDAAAATVQLETDAALLLQAFVDVSELGKRVCVIAFGYDFRDDELAVVAAENRSIALNFLEQSVIRLEVRQRFIDGSTHVVHHLTPPRFELCGEGRFAGGKTGRDGFEDRFAASHEETVVGVLQTKFAGFGSAFLLLFDRFRMHHLSLIGGSARAALLLPEERR